MSDDQSVSLNSGLIRIAVASTIGAATLAALSSAPSRKSSCVLLDPGQSSPVATAAIQAMERHWPDSRFAAPAVGPATSVPLAPGAVRFTGAVVPAWAATAPVALVVHAPARHHQRSPVQVLAGHADRRQQVAARLTGDLGAAAELASAWRVELAIIPGSRGGARFAVVTSTLLAAELAWWALQSHGGEGIGPWEQPSVQRLTSLGQQPAAPAYVQLIPVNIAAGPLAHELAPRLGV